MERPIFSDINSYSGGAEVGLEDVYSKSETPAEDLDDLSSALSESNSGVGLMYSLEGIFLMDAVSSKIGVKARVRYSTSKCHIFIIYDTKLLSNQLYLSLPLAP